MAAPRTLEEWQEIMDPRQGDGVTAIEALSGLEIHLKELFEETAAKASGPLADHDLEYHAWMYWSVKAALDTLRDVE